MRGLCSYPMGTPMVTKHCQKGAGWRASADAAQPAATGAAAEPAGGVFFCEQEKSSPPHRRLPAGRRLQWGLEEKEACADGPSARRSGCCARPSHRAEEVAGHTDRSIAKTAGLCFFAHTKKQRPRPHGATWLILPVVICLSQRLSHACLSINCFIL